MGDHSTMMMGDHNSMGSHGSEHHETTTESMAGPGSAKKCDFSNVVEGADKQMYTFAGLKTDEEGILKLVFDPSAQVKVKLDGQDTQFDCVNGECKSKTAVPAGTYTVMVENMFRGDDGTIPAMFESEKWTSLPLIKTYHVGDKNYCEGMI